MLALARAAQDHLSSTNARTHLASLDMRRGQYAQAAAYYTEVLDVRRRDGEQVGIAAALHNLSRAAFYQGELQRAIALLEESLTHRAAVGDRYEYAWTLDVLAEAVYVADGWPRMLGRLRRHPG